MVGFQVQGFAVQGFGLRQVAGGLAVDPQKKEGVGRGAALLARPRSGSLSWVLVSFFGDFLPDRLRALAFGGEAVGGSDGCNASRVLSLR